MAKLLKNNAQSPQLSERQSLENKYNSARHNLLLVVIFTLVNIVLLFTNSYTYFLFSAFIPYFLVEDAWFFTGKYPGEYYEDIIDEIVFEPDSYLYVMIAIAVVILVVYFLCWLFSKKQRIGWIIAALVLFVIDTAAYIWYWGINTQGIVDLLFHAWVLFYLINAIVVSVKLKKLPPEEEIPVAIEGEVPAATEEQNITEE